MLQEVPVLDISAVIDALKADLPGPGASVVCRPLQAATCCVVQCTCNQWFQPFIVNCQFLAGT